MSLCCVYSHVRNLYPKSSFCSCPYTVLVKCPVRFYSIFDEIGQNVDGKMYFYYRSHCSTTTTESNGSLFSSLAPHSCPQSPDFFFSIVERGVREQPKISFFSLAVQNLMRNKVKSATLLRIGETLEIVLYKDRNNVNIFVDRQKVLSVNSAKN